MNKKFFEEMGKKGAEKRWAKRHEIITELSKHYDKEMQNQFLTWPTKQLQTLLEYIHESKRKKDIGQF